jgi:hypothetical protein
MSHGIGGQYSLRTHCATARKKKYCGSARQTDSKENHGDNGAEPRRASQRPVLSLTPRGVAERQTARRGAAGRMTARGPCRATDGWRRGREAASASSSPLTSQPTTVASSHLRHLSCPSSLYQLRASAQAQARVSALHTPTSFRFCLLVAIKKLPRPSSCHLLACASYSLLPTL